jgi:hypothetical protein
MLKGSTQVNRKTGEWLGISGFKHKFLNKSLPGWELVVIDVEKWKSMPEED